MALPNPVSQILGAEVRGCAPPRLWLQLVIQTRDESRCWYLLAMSFPVFKPLVGIQPPASLLLSWDLLWGLTVFWAFQGSQPCLALTS